MIVVDSNHRMDAVMYASQVYSSGLVSKKKIEEWLGISPYTERAAKTSRYWENECGYCGVLYKAHEVQCTKCGGPR